MVDRQSEGLSGDLPAPDSPGSGRLAPPGPTELIAILHALTVALSIDEVWSQLVGALARYGFVQVNYGLTHLRRDASLGDPEDALYLSNYPPDQIRRYYTTGFYRRTPMWRWVTQNVGSCSWQWALDELALGRLSPGEVQSMADNARNGVRAGYSISFQETRAHRKGAIGLGALPHVSQDEVDSIWTRHGTEIEALCNTAHLKLSQLPVTPHNRALSDRQREALEWVADGKTTQAIATLMGISLAMVEKHLRLARAKLGVETTAHAVAKATVLGTIFTKNQ
jgi:LuxR family transcriptional activator of conjugal transfer of Ti plasmids